jgi:hypothetical protein
MGSVEYRFHYPRTFAVSEPGKLGEREFTKLAKFLGNDFRYAPQEAFGRADWDLIFKGFVDAGATEIAFAQAGEDSYTLVGAGVGVEFQFKRNMVARMDWGFALAEVDDPANPVDVGDNELHFLLTVLY